MMHGNEEVSESVGSYLLGNEDGSVGAMVIRLFSTLQLFI